MSAHDAPGQHDGGCLSLRSTDGQDHGTVCVGTLPGRKRPSLYLEHGNEYGCQVWPLASFVNAEAATQFWRWLVLAMQATSQMPPDAPHAGKRAGKGCT